MLKKSYIAFAFLFTTLFLSTGCIWFLPEGDVPPNLVGEQNTKIESDTVPLKDAEAAMSGAVVRALIRNGYSTQQVPMVFAKTSTPQNRSFVNLLFSTGMVWFTNSKSNAVFLLDSRLQNGVWELRMLKPNGEITLKKTVKYHPNP